MTLKLEGHDVVEGFVDIELEEYDWLMLRWYNDADNSVGKRWGTFKRPLLVAHWNLKL